MLSVLNNSLAFTPKCLVSPTHPKVRRGKTGVGGCRINSELHIFLD